GYFGYGGASGLDFLGTKTMAGHVDHVIDAAEDAIVAVRGKHRAVCGVIRPVAPILAVQILGVLFVVLIHEPLRIAPNRLHNSRPGIANADISRRVGARLNLVSFLIPNHRINSERRGTGAAGLHGVEGRFGGAKEAAGFRLPPSIDDYRFPLADDFVIPLPDFRLDGLTNRGLVLVLVVVFLRFVRAGFA